MFFRKPKTITDQVKVTKHKLDPDVKEAFIGRKTIFSLLSFLLGGVLIGNGLYSLLAPAISSTTIILIGLLLFLTGGVLSQEFRK